MLTVRSSVGSRMNELDALNASGFLARPYRQSYLSELEDLDMADAISEYLQRGTALKASQETFGAAAQHRAVSTTL